VDGPGGPNGIAQFDEIQGIAVDATRNVYVSDTSCVRKVDSNGNVTTFAGNINIFPAASVDGTGGPNGTAQFMDPWGIAVDAAGNVYVADYSANYIRKIDPAGNVTTLAGGCEFGGAYADGTGGPTGTARFGNPAGLAVDPGGNVYVADEGNNRIRKIDVNGNVTTVAGNGTLAHGDGTGGPSGTAEFFAPYGLTIDNAGNIYVGDADNRIRKIDLAENVTTFAGNGMDGAVDGTGGPNGTAQIGDTEGLGTGGPNVYVGAWVVLAIDPSGNVTTVPGSGAASDGGLGAVFVAIGKNGNIYVGEPGNFRIQVIHP
jgi:sugar lactone lactonase YvrE